MAKFLKNFISRRSKSKSPQKPGTFPAEEDFERWRTGNQLDNRNGFSVDGIRGYHNGTIGYHESPRGYSETARGHSENNKIYSGGYPEGTRGFLEYETPSRKHPMRRTMSSNYYEPADYFRLSPKILSTPQPQRKHNGVKMSPNLGRKSHSRHSSKLQLNNANGGSLLTVNHDPHQNESNEYLNNTWNTTSNPYTEIRVGEWNPKRPRSVSPKKSPREDILNDEVGTPRLDGRKSPGRKNKKKQISNTFDYLNPQCKIEGCSATIFVDDCKFMVCKHQLSHASNFFRTLFIDHRAFPISGVEQISLNEYTVVVSGLRYPPPGTQFRWFLESAVPCPLLKDITEETLETCMRLSKRFQSKGLEVRCQKFIIENVSMKPPVMALCWLNWILKHKFDKKCLESCLPTVARLSLSELESHRKMLTEKIIADLLAMKLRTCYQQASIAFQTIHQMDHFQVDVEKCPRCNRIKEQGRIRLYANPCQKLIGCERCLHDHDRCELGRRLKGTDYQAFYQCDHGLWPFNDRTEDCHCQLGLYQAQLHVPRAKLVTYSREGSPEVDSIKKRYISKISNQNNSA